MDSAKALISNATSGMEGLTIGQNGIAFSEDGKNLFFYIKETPGKDSDSGSDAANHLIIWRYNDDILNANPGTSSKEFEAAINLKSRQQVIRLENSKLDCSCARFEGGYCNDRVLVVSNSTGYAAEHRWRLSARPDLYLVSTVDGSRRDRKSVV